MELEHGNILCVSSNTEVVFCKHSLNCNSSENTNASTNQNEINGFGLTIFKEIYYTTKKININQLSSVWCLLNPSERLKTFRNDKNYDQILLQQDQNVTLAFGSLISSSQFKCAASKFCFTKGPNSIWNLYFAKYNSFLSINTEFIKFQLKRDHIDIHRGVIISARSSHDFIMHVCLRGNLEEYTSKNRQFGYERQFCLQNTRDEQPWQSCFSAMHFSIHNEQKNTNSIYQILCYFIQFFSYHSIPIHFGSIEFLYENFIYRNNLLIPANTFIGQYACHMLTSVGCQIYDQIVNDDILNNNMFYLLNGNNNDDDFVYYIFERLRRLTLSSENYFLQLLHELPTIRNNYYDSYLQSTFYQMDMVWTKYVRIPWFCFTPTRLIIKPFKFMRSNRVFRYISNVTQSMGFVEFRDDTGSASLSKELVPFLQHYLQNGFWFADRHYIYLHHAQSQIRQKQFYFYCEHEGNMTREALEAWMGNFDREKLPAKNTARRTQPFSSTEATIEIDKKLVGLIPDLKTTDGKYNFTDGVGQISSELNLLIHESIGKNVNDGDYISSVLQIRYGGCKGTIAVNPLLDGKEKQLLIRPSMNKFECEHQMLELCKRSLRRHLCLNREVINLLSYRGISNAHILVVQLRNILWLMASFVSNQSALYVLREKILHVLPWSKISFYSHLSKEPFFHRLLLTTVTNNLCQIITRAHIRVSKARYMFGTVDEYKVLKEGQVFVQITNEYGSKTVLEGPIAITKNPCHHPGDLRVLEAVNNSYLHHLYDVLVFPQQGSRPHANEISGSDLDGDEYSVIWNSELVPTSPNPIPYDYDSGPSPKPLNRVVTRNDRLKVISDICEQDNLGRLSNIHLVLADKFGIDHEKAINLAAGISQELDSVKSSQHPYTSEQIKQIILTADKTRPDFMQASGYKEYQSEKILGKLFRSARRLSDTFKNLFLNNNNEIFLDKSLLHNGYEEYIGSARNLYKQYEYEMLEIIGSYGFSNEIDLFCCIDSHNMKANERSDIQQTAQELLRAVFQNIQKNFHDDLVSLHQAKAKAAACYYVAYTDTNDKDKSMLSFPWLFASQLLADYSVISEDEQQTNDFMENTFISDSILNDYLKQQLPSLINLLPNDNQFTFMELLEICFQNACVTNNEKMINHAEILIELLIKTAKTIHSN
ncbi:unnamed protein product [Rotaria sordida]|uniref:RNA-dependent RNA polymerase n=1 Tax=Rotaria sordida TaxID=392033 RepID=A0A813TWV5_9BILA|nr:unnamed protein product [Rotaria sordida]CAF0947491.1 unnamed protein product [Rotaria sordida]